MPSSVSTLNPTGGFPGSSFKYTPLRHLRVLGVSFIQGLFQAAPPNNYHWTLDEETTEIVIRAESPLNVDTVAKRPAINLTVGTVQFYSLGMDDMFTYDAALDRKVKVVLVPGTLSYNCCSRVDIECHDLAWVVAEHLWLLRELLLKAGFFEIGRGISIGAPSPAGTIVQGDQGDEWYCSTVTVPFQFSRKSAFTPLGQHIANNIQLNIEARYPRLGEGRGGPAVSDHEFPVKVTEVYPPSFAPGATDTYGRTPDPAGTRTYSLPTAPHPLNPAKLVYVETVRPYRVGARRLV